MGAPLILASLVRGFLLTEGSYNVGSLRVDSFYFGIYGIYGLHVGGQVDGCMMQCKGDSVGLAFDSSLSHADASHLYVRSLRHVSMSLRQVITLLSYVITSLRHTVASRHGVMGPPHERLYVASSVAASASVTVSATV